MVAPVRGLCIRCCKRSMLPLHQRWLSSQRVIKYQQLKKSQPASSEEVRNIGIMAHIDAGKTTTTERMLYYSGLTSTIGDVDDGDTITDYMEQERKRGITIASAAVTFPWQGHVINLIDTPGHVDFTIEVERCLRVLDGTVTILDASAGVEAQTLTVWKQADRYGIPRLGYLNKMDKRGADIRMCLESMAKKLHCLPLLTQVPIGAEKSFSGLVDVVDLQVHSWQSPQGWTRTPLDSDESIADSADIWDAREKLVESLTDVDDVLAERLIELENSRALSNEEIKAALRRATISMKCVPVLLGSSLKNLGVQPLMDGIVSYLPSPLDLGRNYGDLYDDDLCGFSFKSCHDAHKGFLTFLRLYSGSIAPGQKVYNVQKGRAERIEGVFAAFANEFRPQERISAGNIAVVSGLKETTTGDILCKSSSSHGRALEAASKRGKQLVAEMAVPTPVFFCSIEPPSLHAQAGLEHALACLAKEDPSLRVAFDADTGQTVLAGMGELHLEIVRDRISKEYKIDAELGPLQVAYRETITNKVSDTLEFQRRVGESHHYVKLSMTALPEKSGKVLELQHTKENAENLGAIRPYQMSAVERGLHNTLACGPLLHCPVVNASFRLWWLETRPGTSEVMIQAATSQLAHQLLSGGQPRLLEPVMSLEISVHEDHFSVVLGDLARRRAQILSIQQRLDIKVIECLTPLSELKGYSTALRTLSSGMASVSMELLDYLPMDSMEQSRAIQSMTGISTSFSSPKCA